MYKDYDIPDYEMASAVQQAFGGLKLDCNHNGSQYNFVCPFCGSSSHKKHAYVYADKWIFVCYKCTPASPLISVLRKHKDKYGDIYRHLMFSMYGSKDRAPDPRIIKNEPVLPKGLPFSEGELVSITDPHDPEAAAGLALVNGRRIRESVYSRWFVCRTDSSFWKRDSSGNVLINTDTHRPYGNEYRGRIIIPYYKFGGSWTQFDARAIDPEVKLRYSNYAGVRRDMYNIDFLNTSRRFYLLEGSIDSTFIHNAAAFGGIQHLRQFLEMYPEIPAHSANCTIIWDNDDPGRLGALDAASLNFGMLDWGNVRAKDVNAAVLSGELPVDANGYVDASVVESMSLPPEKGSYRIVRKYGSAYEIRNRMQNPAIGTEGVLF